MDKIHNRNPNPNPNKTQRFHVPAFPKLLTRLHKKMSVTPRTLNSDLKTRINNKNNIKILPNVP